MSTNILPPPLFTTFDFDTPRVRRSDPHTSHEAADTNNVEASIGAVLDTLKKDGPMTDEQLVTVMHARAVWGEIPRFTEQRIRTARAALVERGLVRDAGFTRRTVTGRNARVWEACR